MDIPDIRPLLLDGDYHPAFDRQGSPDPERFGQLAADFISSGSDAITVPCADSALVQAAVSVAGGRVPVGGLIPPSNLELVPFGTTTFEHLIAHYRDQMRVYADAGLSFVILDGFTGIADLRAALFAARPFDLKVFAIMEVADECRTAVRDADVLAALIVAEAMGAAAFGVTASGGAKPLIPALERLYPYASIPLIARADAGCPNPVLEHLYDLSPRSMAGETELLLEAGAQIIGGRNGVTPEHITAMKETVQGFDFGRLQKMQPEYELLAANHREAFFIPQAPEISEPLSCTLDMSEALMETADLIGIDVIAISIVGIDDAHLLAENAHMATLPILIHCDDEAALEQALLHYQGRALVDSQSFIPPERLAQIAARYGAIVY